MDSFTVAVPEQALAGALRPPVSKEGATEGARARALEALYATGHWLLSHGRVHDAASVFRGMAVLAPGDERAWLALGACHEALKQTQLALEIYGTAQVMGGPGVRSRLARARILARTGREDEADAVREGAFEVAASLDDDELIALVAAERGAA